MKQKLLIKIEELYYLENYDQVIAKTNQLIKIDPDSVEGYLLGDYASISLTGIQRQYQIFRLFCNVNRTTFRPSATETYALEN